MKIIFKNVGQGDSIIIDNGRDNVGIVDCKRYGSENPTVEYLKQNQVQKISFLLLSHPHYDHFSGLLELLEFCFYNNVQIKRFIHTCNVHPSYLNWASIDEQATKLLEQIIYKVIELEEIGLIQSIEHASLNWQIPIGNSFQLKCLSPSDREIRNYIKKVDLLKGGDELKCSQSANLLSTILQISNSKMAVLLTSDAESDSFERLETRIDSFSDKIELCQIPHHGAGKNHVPSFWQKLETEPSCPAVISVGRHNNYSHPHSIVVNDFKEMNFKVYCTNDISGITTNNEASVEINKLALALNSASVLLEYPIGGDQSFLIENETVSVNS